MQIHGTVVRWHEKGILFLGDSGCGKSTAALLLMAKGAQLVADDRVSLDVFNNQWVAFCPDTIKNKMEVRGVGLVNVKALDKTPLDLAVVLVKNFQDVPRMPEKEVWELEGIVVPKITLCAFECAFAERLDALLQQL